MAEGGKVSVKVENKATPRTAPPAWRSRPRSLRDADTTAPILTIAPEKVYFVIAKARQFDAKDIVTDPDLVSNGSDDGMRAVLENHTDDPVRLELSRFIRGLNVDEQVDLVALAWIGRGDGDLDSWDEVRGEAARAHNNRTASYLIGMPLLAGYLEDAMAQFGYDEEDFEN